MWFSHLITSQRLWPVLMRVCSARNFNVNASWHGSLQPSRVQFVKLLLDSEQNSTAAPRCHDLNTRPHLRMLETRAPRSAFLHNICSEWNHMTSLPLSAGRSNLTVFQIVFRHTTWNTAQKMSTAWTQVWVSVIPRITVANRTVQTDIKSEG